MNAEFEDIRPYSDEEICAVLDRFARNRWLMKGIRKEVYSRWSSVFAPLLDLVVRRYFRKRFASVRTVDEFQRKITVDIVLEWIVNHTTEGLSFSGLENLDKTITHIFISNHRDIVLDSALLNYVLAKNHFPIFAIAFGDNLMVNDLVSDLIRANKSFVVKRKLPFKERIQAAYQLSRYIWVLLHQGESVWIAQGEGRAKDGNDRTNPSLIKMLYMSQRKGGLRFNEFVHEMNIVPVAVSYEKDPCDLLKARELQERANNSHYKKEKEADIQSMYLGLRGGKGRVHFAISKPLRGEYRNELDVAKEIDRVIQGMYKLWPSNYIAYDEKKGSGEYSSKYSPDQRKAFLNRFAGEAPEICTRALAMYAQPVINQRALITNGR
jgi:1-acyl-sn-glycerol-3-phosphate acyltransferase